MSEHNAPTAFDLEARALTKHFGDFTAVNNIDLAIEPGSFFSILGPSGCGKTSLLRMIAGFSEPSSGELLIKGRSMLGVPANRRPVNMVFQHLALFPMMSVAQNIAYGLERRGEKREDIARKVDAVLARIGLPDAGKKKISALSGGQKQRVAIARCLVLEPDLLLLDEPLGALDLKLREHMKVELKKLQHAFDTTFVYITHDQSEALVMSDKVAVMNHGRFEQVGAPADLYHRPASSFVASFVGDSNRWQGQVEQANGAEMLVRLTSGAQMMASTPTGQNAPAVGSKVDLFLRPEAVNISQTPVETAIGCQITGQVDNQLFNGAASMMLVRTEQGDEIQVACPPASGFELLPRGAEVNLHWQAGAVLAFEAGEIAPEAD